MAAGHRAPSRHFDAPAIGCSFLQCSKKMRRTYRGLLHGSIATNTRL
jgi:hypothetical protein